MAPSRFICAGGVAVDAHLVLERRRSRCALRAPSEPSAFGRNFGTTNSEMPLRAGRRIRQARQHQVDDVLGQVVLAGRDEDLAAGDACRCRRPAARPWCAACRGRCRSAARSGTSCRSTRRSPAWAGTAPSARSCRARAGTRRRRATGPGTWSRPGWPSSASRRGTGSATMRQALAAVLRVAATAPASRLRRTARRLP